jgi:hypothetical protein
MYYVYSTVELIETCIYFKELEDETLDDNIYDEVYNLLNSSNIQTEARLLDFNPNDEYSVYIEPSASTEIKKYVDVSTQVGTPLGLYEEELNECIEQEKTLVHLREKYKELCSVNKTLRNELISEIKSSIESLDKSN